MRRMAPLLTGFAKQGRTYVSKGYYYRIYLPAEDGSPVGGHEKGSRMKQVDGDLSDWKDSAFTDGVWDIERLRHAPWFDAKRNRLTDHGDELHVGEIGGAEGEVVGRAPERLLARAGGRLQGVKGHRTDDNNRHYVFLVEGM